MPLYETRKHAENRIEVRPEWRDAIVIGPDAVADALLGLVANRAEPSRPLRMAFDGWYDVDWAALRSRLEQKASAAELTLDCRPAVALFRPRDEIDAYKRAFTETGDPGFGIVNTAGHIIDLMVPEKVAALKADLAAAGGADAVIVFGPGAAVPELFDGYDVRLYFDKTRQPILWEMWDGRLVPFGWTEPKPDYFWKEYYYCDYYLLDRQKEFLVGRMDYWVEAISHDGLKLVPRAAYDGILRTLVQHPVKEVPIFQPGPWGAYRYRDLFDVPGLECNAWNELAGPELSMLVDVGREAMLNMPAMNLMQYAQQFVGPHIAETYPSLFPMDVWLDDGYFPKPTPAERTSMPIHNHPDTDYVRRHFKEPLGRYETYYIAEAYEGANTWMGFKDDADVEEWERLCRDSENRKEIPNWKGFIANWDSNVGDLYLIPPGTTHAHGGNQMVLEMDTCPSIAATEYSFFTYDFARPSWDDDTKTMTGTPQSNRVIAEAVDQGRLDVDALGEDDFILKQTDRAGSAVLLIAARSPRAVVYGVCTLFERLGCTFLISGDRFPERDPELALPVLDETGRTDCSWRGILWGGFCFATNSMCSLADYEAMLDQMLKMKMNRLILFHFPSEPFIDYTFRGERKLVGDISHPDSGFISYGRHFTGSWRVADLPVHRDAFDRERIAPLEFQSVETSAEALDTGRAFIQRILELARERGIGVWLSFLPQFATPNLSKYARPMTCPNPHWCVPLSCTDPVVGPLNRARIEGIVEAYPDLEGILLGIPEGFFEDPYPETAALIEREWDRYAEALALQGEYWGTFWPGEERQKEHIRADIAFTEIVKTTIREAKDVKPDLRLGIFTVCKAYLLTRLHQILPLDMPFVDIESRALWTLEGAPLHLFRRMKGRDCAIVPRAVDDGSLLGLQFPLWQYSQDGFLASPKENGTRGLMIQTTHIRGNEHSTKYLAQGMWGGPQAPDAFYESYVELVFGKAAAPAVADAFRLLEENDEFLGGRGLGNMRWNMVPQQILIMTTFRDFDRPFHAAPFSKKFVDACEASNEKFRVAIETLARARDWLEAGRDAADPRGRAELDYILARTRGYRAHLRALVGFGELYASYYTMFEHLPGDLDGFRATLSRVTADARALEERARQAADCFAECVEHTTDLAMLWMVSHKMVLGSRCLRRFLGNIRAFYEAREYWQPVDWDTLFGRPVFPPHAVQAVPGGSGGETPYEPG
jgi:hypothetical protein